VRPSHTTLTAVRMVVMPALQCRSCMMQGHVGLLVARTSYCWPSEWSKAHSARLHPLLQPSGTDPQVSWRRCWAT
jgi:hypothetical protein